MHSICSQAFPPAKQGLQKCPVQDLPSRSQCAPPSLPYLLYPLQPAVETQQLRPSSAASHQPCQALEGLIPEGKDATHPDANQQLSAMWLRCSILCRPQSKLQQMRFTQIAGNSWAEPEPQATQGKCIYTGSLQENVEQSPSTSGE